MMRKEEIKKRKGIIKRIKDSFVEKYSAGSILACKVYNYSGKTKRNRKVVRHNLTE